MVEHHSKDSPKDNLQENMEVHSLNLQKNSLISKKKPEEVMALKFENFLD